jgi:16S rRNA (guanine527-N7)-methyltransferase
LYQSELKKWNKAYNLTAITDDREIVIKHFLDSLLYLKAIPGHAKTLCDVGTGAGFPGLPIALVRPDLSMALVEPSRKRCAFLRHMEKRLALANVEVIESNAEGVEAGSFDVVLTRATFSIADLLKKAGHLAKTGGFFLLSKGPKYEEELKALAADMHPEIITVGMDSFELVRHLIRISNK